MAIETRDVIFASGGFTRVPKAIKLSLARLSKLYRTISKNLENVFEPLYEVLKMKDKEKTKEQLINESIEMRLG